MRHVPAALRITTAAMIVATSAVGAPLAADESSTAIPVDRQAYMATSPFDPCQESKTSICVGAAGNMLTMLSFIHLNLPRLPGGSSLKSSTVTLVQDANAAANVNTSAAAMRACVLLVELQPTFDRQNPPPYDCNLAQSVAMPDGRGGWSLDLTSLAGVWGRIGNTGAALVANFGSVAPAPGVVAASPQGWSLSLDRSRSKAVGVYEVPSAATLGAARSDDPVAAFIETITAPATTQPAPVEAATGQPAPLALPNPPAADVSLPDRSAPVVLHTSWLLALLTLVAGSFGLLLGEAFRRVEQQSRTSPRALAAAVSGARSRMAAPLAILWLIALISIGALGKASP